MAGARNAVPRPPTLSSSPAKEHQGERSPLPTTMLSANTVIHMDISLVTVRTANQTPLVLRRNTTLHGPIRAKRRRASLKKLTSLTRRLNNCAFYLLSQLAQLVVRKRTKRPCRTHVLKTDSVNFCVRGASGTSAEILSCTETTLNMKPAVGKQRK